MVSLLLLSSSLGLTIFFCGNFATFTHGFYSQWSCQLGEMRRSTGNVVVDGSSGSDLLKDLLENQTNEEQKEQVQSERNLRFQGVGRLYVGQNIDSVDPDHPLDPHIQIVERLASSTVAIVGLGGVGSWAAEALCRSGVGNLVLIDLDDICISNTNRQLHTTSQAVGEMKIDEMKRRLLSINPQCNIVNIHQFVSRTNVNHILDGLLPDLDACLDAIDGSLSKTALIAACVEKKIPIVTCGGAAGKTDPTRVTTDDLTRVHEDKLLSTCRTGLRRQYGFAAGIKIGTKKRGKTVKKWRVQTVYSTEPPKELPEGETDKVTALRRCDGALGTACFVTGTFGFVAAGLIVNMIANNAKMIPRKG